MSDAAMANHPGSGGRPSRLATGAIVAAIVVSLAASLAAAVFWKQPSPGVLRMPGDAILQYRDLVFADLPGAAVGVTDAADGREVAVYQPGEGAFLRSMMRGLASERRRNGGSESTPFRLARHMDGRLTIEDRFTGRVIVISSFGPTQVEAFARLLPNTRGDRP